MNENAQLALIAMIGTTLTAVLALVGTFVVAWFNLRKLQLETAKKVEEVHQVVNGQSEKLLKITGEAERAKGVIEGIEKAENK